MVNTKWQRVLMSITAITAIGIAGTILFSDKQLNAQDGTFSPRQYCRQTGGHVTETNVPHKYICWYKNKGVLTNTQVGVSTLIRMEALVSLFPPYPQK